MLAHNAPTLDRPSTSHPGGELRASLVKLLPELLGRATRLSGSETLAADLVQDTVERALRFEGCYRPGTNPRAYLHQILFSVFITHCRRARRGRKATLSLTIDPNAWTAREPVREVECLGASLRARLGELPEAYQAVIVLIDLGERSYKDAAKLLGVPVGTVMSRLHRARKALRASIERDGSPVSEPIHDPRASVPPARLAA